MAGLFICIWYIKSGNIFKTHLAWMLKKKTIKAFVKKRLNNAEDQMLQYCSTKDGECLHKLRVEVKKLNALIRLMNFCAAKKQQLNKKPVDELFKSAGEIRTAFVHIDLLKEHDIQTGDFITDQQTIISNSTVAFCSKNNMFKTLLRKTHKKVFKKVKSISKKNVHRFFKKQTQKIIAGFAVAPTEAQLHGLRKRLKELLYVFEMMPQTLQQAIGLNVDYVNHLQEEIGHWHDAVATRVLLQQAQMHRFVQPIEQKQTSLYNKILLQTVNMKQKLFV